MVQDSKTECKLYKRRWLMLALFVFYSMSNAFQWIEYSIIANVVQKYYNVPSTYIDWTSMIYMVVYIPLIFPASWFLDKVGLKITLITGAFINCLAAWIKVPSTSPDLFYVSFIGQVLAGISQLFVLNVPSALAALWFGPEEVSSACSIGVFGNQLGVALGFLLPPIIVKNSSNQDVIGNGLKTLFYSVAGVTTVILLSIVIFFQSAPDLPPSPAQAVQRASDSKGFVYSIKQLALNPGYRLLLVSYGINVGVYYAISTLLNQIVLFYYPGKEEDAGRIGLTIVVAGMVGSLLCGIILDKTRRFKEVTIAVYSFSLLGMVVYTFTLGTGIISLVYVVAGLLGFFMTGYLSVGFEFGAELTYPEPEGTSSGLLNASAQVFGIVCTLLYSYIFSNYGDLWSNIMLCAVLFIGTTMTFLIKSDLKRQAAHEKSQHTKP
uniref:Choline/ethanolamine transporter FLVCR1 n=1 Tax=Clastoptera arizonana TaxID=38151 RepID=A0A1B6E568_9HEMI